AVVPGGEGMLGELKAFNAGEKAGVLPAQLVTLAAPTKPAQWERFSGAHPLMAPFVQWARSADPDFERPELRPFARRYWRMSEPTAPQSSVIIRYQDDKKSPALAERLVGSGRVVVFTSPLDRRLPAWDNYGESAFVVALIDRVCLYLGGESAPPEMSFRCGV